jgi:hypothetical protein
MAECGGGRGGVAAEDGVIVADGGVAAESGVASACLSARRRLHPPPEREKPLDRASGWSSAAAAATGWSSGGCCGVERRHGGNGVELGFWVRKMVLYSGLSGLRIEF